MKKHFFSLDKNKTQLQKIKSAINGLATNDPFEMEKIKHISYMVSSFIEDDLGWDDYCQFNIEKIGDTLLNYTINDLKQGSGTDDILSDCFRFLIERYLTQSEKPNGNFIAFKNFATDKRDELSSIASQQILYATNSMPIDIFKEKINDNRLDLINDFLQKYDETKKLLKNWEDDHAKRIKAVQTLKDNLDNQKDAYNFVGLNKGFSNISDKKEKEKGFAFLAMIILGASIIAPIALEIYILTTKENPINLTHALLIAAPTLSLVLVLIYYFRIALQNYNSIKTQINQIELRKSLCQFIQNYAQYSSVIKQQDASALEKFENIIFSNIVSNDEKLPSTFDGIDSLANLIKSLKSPH